MTVTTLANARDSIRRAADAASAASSADPLSLKGVLWWGWHAVALLAYNALRPARDDLDAWLWDYLEPGETALDPERDAHWSERERLSLLELLDVLSVEDLPILEPSFYQGWQDRTERCRTLRRQIRQVLGGSSAIADEAARRDLLLLLAAYHRLLRMPASVSLDVGAVLAALPRLFELMAALARASPEDADGLVAGIEAGRRALAAAI